MICSPVVINDEIQAQTPKDRYEKLQCGDLASRSQLEPCLIYLLQRARFFATSIRETEH